MYCVYVQYYKCPVVWCVIHFRCKTVLKKGAQNIKYKIKCLLHELIYSTDHEIMSVIHGSSAGTENEIVVKCSAFAITTLLYEMYAVYLEIMFIFFLYFVFFFIFLTYHFPHRENFILHISCNNLININHLLIN